MLNDNTRGVVAGKDALVDGLALGVRGEESTDEGVAGAVGVDDLGAVDERDGDLAGLALGRGPDGGALARGEDDEARAGRLLGELGGLHGDLGEVLGAVELLHRGEGLRLVLVGEDDVEEGQDLVELRGEELHDEGCGEVHGDLAAVARDAVVDGVEQRRRVGEREAGQVDELDLVEDLEHALGLEVRGVEVVGGAEVGEERALLADDADGARAGGRGGVLGVLEGHVDALLLGGLLHELAVGVVGDAAGVGDEAAVGRLREPLGDAGGVEAGAAGDVLDVALALELGVDGLLVALAEPGGAGLEAVLVEEGLVDVARDVEQRVADDEQAVGDGRRDLRAEGGDGGREAVGELDLGLPAEHGLGLGDVGLALLGVVLGGLEVDDLGRRSGDHGRDEVGGLLDGELDGVAEVDGAGLGRVLDQAPEALDEVRDELERARVLAGAVDGDVAVGQRLHGEVGDDAAVVGAHARAVRVEDARDADLDAVVAVVVEAERLGAALALVVARADAGARGVAPVGLDLGVDERVAVDLGGGGDEDGAVGRHGELEDVVGAVDAGERGADGVVLVVDGRRGAGEVEDVVPLCVEHRRGEVEDDVVVDEGEARVGAVVLEVDGLAGVEVVEDGDVGALGHGAVDDVRADEASTASDEDLLSSLEGNSRHFIKINFFF